MIIGIPKEIKNNENRVSVTPAGVFSLKAAGNEVIVEKGAGEGSGFTDEEYIKAGAQMADVEEVFKKAELIVKVKEPIESEYKYLRQDQLLFTYLHLAADKPLTDALIKAKTTAIAYETIKDKNGALPLLSPMSEIAGRMAVQLGANMLLKTNGGQGILLGGAAGVAPAKVVVVGGGTVGFNAAKVAAGMGASVILFDVNTKRLEYINDVSNGRIQTQYSHAYSLMEELKTADLLIGAVLIPGAKAPKIVTEEMVKNMKKGSVLVDVAIDQGGCIQTVDRATTHDDPCYEKYGVIHYSVANMPGAAPKTATMALSNATLPYVLKIAKKGIDALKEDAGFLEGLNTFNGMITNEGVAKALGYKCVDAKTVL